MFLASKDELKRSFFDGEIFSLNKFELSAFMPWFICEVPEFEEDSDEAVCTTTHLIGDIDDLADFAESRKVDKTYLVSPGHLLNQDNWSLSRLKSVSIATYIDDKYKSSVYRFEIDTGQVIEHDISGLNKGQYELTFEKILQFG
jgi:hypothetical protein